MPPPRRGAGTGPSTHCPLAVGGPRPPPLLLLLLLLPLLLLPAPCAAAAAGPPRCNISTVAGTPQSPGNASGSATGGAQLHTPVGVAVAPSGEVFTLQNEGHQLRVYAPPPAATLGTAAGTGAVGANESAPPFADGPALAATLWFVWRRDMLGTIVAGTAAMLICRLGLGW